MPVRCALFCRVIDNYGDIGVCWRLAHQLHHEKQIAVTLWLDDWQALAKMMPGFVAQVEPAMLDGIVLRHWPKDGQACNPEAEIVIEAFACNLPVLAIQAMAACSSPPLWLNLEYLSAESWAESHHLLPSPHPHYALTKRFYFPGFSLQSGGLLREANLLGRRDGFDLAQQRAFFDELGVTIAEGAFKVLLFSYENTAISGFLKAWIASTRPIHCLVPEGRVLMSLSEFIGQPLAAGSIWRQGALTIQIIPFVAQPNFDALLWCCDLNIVRGEDSFVRAQWAAKPMLWHIYPQEQDAHLRKLDAFMAHYLEAFPQADAIRIAWLAWNTQSIEGIAQSWPALMVCYAAWRLHSQTWAAQLAAQPDLVSRLLALTE